MSRLPSQWRLVRLRIAPQRQWLNAAIDLLEAGINVRPQDNILKTLEAALGPRFEGSDIPWVHFLSLVDHFEDHVIVISDDEEPKVSRLGNLVELLLTPASDHHQCPDGYPLSADQLGVPRSGGQPSGRPDSNVFRHSSGLCEEG